MMTSQRKSTWLAGIALPILLMILPAGVGPDVVDLGPCEETDFTIMIETTPEHVVLSCYKGCAWGILSFRFTLGDRPQAVDQYGMTDALGDGMEAEDGQRAFRFTLERTESEIRLHGLVGTAWEEVSFGCPKGECSQAIDQNGMTTIAE